MAAILATAVRLFGIGGVLFILAIFFYEGIPGAPRIPFLTSIPIVSDIVAGRVETVAAQRVKEATSNMVTKYERDVLAAQLAKERRDRESAQIVASEALKRADATQRAKDEADAKVEALEAAARQDGMDGWSKEELEWLKRH